MSTVHPAQVVITNEQRENNLKKLDALAENIVAFTTGVGGLNELGIWAGGVKAENLTHATAYSFPALVLAVALAFALGAKFIQWWDANPQTYAAVFARKRILCQAAIWFSIAGAVLFFIAIFLYITRAA
jgi:hypothetical protein